MKPEDLKAIRQRHAASTPGVWIAMTYVNGGEYEVEISTQINHIRYTNLLSTRARKDPRERHEADANFVATAHQDVPALCDALDLAWKILSEMAEDSRSFQQGYREGQKEIGRRFQKLVGDGRSSVVELMLAMVDIRDHDATLNPQLMPDSPWQDRPTSDGNYWVADMYASSLLEICQIKDGRLWRLGQGGHLSVDELVSQGCRFLPITIPEPPPR